MNFKIAKLMGCFYCVVILVCTAVIAQADRYVINQSDSVIQSSIRYTVIGKYHAQFGQYEGEIIFDENTEMIKSVYLKIYAFSVKSRYSVLDKIVKSGRILDVGQYPEIIFKSHAIYHDGGRYQVEGDLTLHGVTQLISFPFNFQLINSSDGEDKLEAEGVWIIFRKKYGIYWHNFLDKFGIIVGNHITVNWKISASRQ